MTTGETNIVNGSRERLRIWRSVRRWYWATSAIGASAWVAGGLALLAGGDAPGPDWADASGYQGGASRMPHGTQRALLVLGRTAGWPRDRQVDVVQSYATKWRGPGASIPGVTWVDDKDLYWSPTEKWGRIGARGFSVRLGAIDQVDVTRLRRASTGLVVRTRDDVEIWLWLGDANPLLQGITRPATS